MIKIESVIALIEKGATEGERQAARAAYKRITGNEYSKTYDNLIHYANTSHPLDPNYAYTEKKSTEFYDELRKHRDNSTNFHHRVVNILEANKFKLFSMDAGGIQNFGFQHEKDNFVIFVTVNAAGEWELMTHDGAYEWKGKFPSDLQWHIKRAKGDLHKN